MCLLFHSPIRLSSSRDLISAILSRALRRMLRVGKREEAEHWAKASFFCLRQTGFCRPTLCCKRVALSTASATEGSLSQ